MRKAQKRVPQRMQWAGSVPLAQSRVIRSLALTISAAVAMAWPFAGCAAAEDQPGWRVSIQLRVKGQPVELVTDVRCVAHQGERQIGGPETFFAPQPMGFGKTIDAETAVAAVVPYVCGRHADTVNVEYLPLIGLIDLPGDTIDLYVSRRALSNPSEPVNYLGWSAIRLPGPAADVVPPYDWFHAPAEGAPKKCYYGHVAIPLSTPGTPAGWPYMTREAEAANYLSFSWDYSQRLGSHANPDGTLTSAFLGWGLPPHGLPRSHAVAPQVSLDMVTAMARLRPAVEDHEYLSITKRQGVIRYYASRDCKVPLAPIQVQNGARLSPGNVVDYLGQKIVFRSFIALPHSEGE